MHHIYKNPVLGNEYVVEDLGFDLMGDGSMTYVKIIEIISHGSGIKRPVGSEFQIASKNLYVNPNELLKRIL